MEQTKLFLYSASTLNIDSYREQLDVPSLSAHKVPPLNKNLL